MALCFISRQEAFFAYTPGHDWFGLWDSEWLPRAGAHSESLRQKHPVQRGDHGTEMVNLANTGTMVAGDDNHHQGESTDNFQSLAGRAQRLMRGPPPVSSQGVERRMRRKRYLFCGNSLFLNNVISEKKTLIHCGFVLCHLSLLHPTGWCLDEDVKPGQEKG